MSWRNNGCSRSILMIAMPAPAAWSPLPARSVSIATDVAEEMGGAAGRAMDATAHVSSSAARF
eukprot:2875023-Pyramimonas_sp.AAC.1